MTNGKALRPPPWTPPAGDPPTLDHARKALRDLVPFQQPALDGLRPAAVLVAMSTGPHGLEVLLTRRSQTVSDHRGQVAFPGGSVDPEDRDSLAAALREAREEVGLAEDSLEVLGRLDDLPTITGFHVTPWVVHAPSFEGLAPATAEVDALFPFPLVWLADERRIVRIPWQPGALRLEVLFIPYGEFLIWGATARILWQLWEVLR